MRRRIVVCLGLLLVLCLLGDLIATLSLDRSIGQLSALAESHRIQSLRAELTASGVRVDRDLLGYISAHGHTVEMHEDSLRRFTVAVSRCGACHHEPRVKSRLDSIRETFDAYREAAEPLFAAAEPTGPPALAEKAAKLADRLVTETTALSDLAERHLMVRNTDVAESVQRARMVLYGTLVIALVVGGVVAFHLLRRLTQPVDALLEGIERVRQGDLSFRFSVRADREFQTLANAFNDAYQSLKKAQEGIVQADKMAAVGKLAAGIAHEIGNPLASISSITQMMRRQCDSPEQAERIGLIMGEINRISRIVRELLSFSRPPTGETRGRVDVADLLERAGTLLGYDKRSQKIRVTRHVEPDLRPIRGNADKLLVVFTNIMINAFDALCDRRDGTGTLSITARQEGGDVELRFEDDGPGMNRELIASAFEPFFTTKEPGAGTGLGLWICYQEVQRHQGTIRIESRPDQGTTVIVVLPCEPSETALTGDEPSDSSDSPG